MLRDAAELLGPSVEQAINALENITESDSGAVQMARRYAAVIDSSNGHCRGCDDPDCRRTSTSSWAMRWIAPLLLDCLESLGATPRGRTSLKTRPAAGVSQLDKLRASRRA